MWRELARRPGLDTGVERLRVHVIDWPVDLAQSACYQLVVGVGHPLRSSKAGEDAVDVWTEIDEAVGLWRERLVPFRDNLEANRRAPRRRVAELAEPDPKWPTDAQRLIARLRRLLGGDVLRVDHIGSTSVPGLPAKDLIDIQVVVQNLNVADALARRSRSAGFVRVPGRWTGRDRHGTEFDEIVLVDADPGRPVNVNLRPFHDPVWGETLLFREWLRASEANRDEYLSLKRGLIRATTRVDDYSSGKQAWIGEALERASAWAERVLWGNG